MFFDNIILFLNVLEQFAIRVTIFDFNIEDIIKYVNKIFFEGDNNAYGEKFIMTTDQYNNKLANEIPRIISTDINALDQKISNSNLSFKYLSYNSFSVSGNKNSFSYIYDN
jgi:hypothetical protein